MDITVFRHFSDEVMKSFMDYVDLPLRDKEIHLLTIMDKEANMPLHFYAHHIGLEKGSFTYLTEVMEEKGYVIRKQHPYDGRRKELVLTDKGRQTVEEIRALKQSYFQQFFKEMPDADVEILNQAVDVIRRFLEMNRFKRPKDIDHE